VISKSNTGDTADRPLASLCNDNMGIDYFNGLYNVDVSWGEHLNGAIWYRVTTCVLRRNNYRRNI